MAISSGREGLRIWSGRLAPDEKGGKTTNCHGPWGSIRYLCYIKCSFLPELELERYLVQSRAMKYNSEQALALLAWHKMDLTAAWSDLAKFTPVPDTWSLQDKEDFAAALEVDLFSL